MVDRTPDDVTYEYIEDCSFFYILQIKPFVLLYLFILIYIFMYFFHTDKITALNKIKKMIGKKGNS